MAERTTGAAAAAANTAAAEQRKADYRNESEGRLFQLEIAAGATVELTRREWLQALGAGLLLTVRDAGAAAGAPIATRIHIGEDGNITLLTGKVELGQGARTLLTQAAAEELKVPPSRLRLVMGDTALVPDDGGTWASLTTPQTVPAVRDAAARAHALLVKLAAAMWGVAAEAVQSSEGTLSAPGRKISYGELARLKQLGEEKLPEARPVAPDLWRVCGRTLADVRGREIVTGALRYPSDQAVPGMWYGKIVRAAAYQAELLSVDSSGVQQDGEVRVVRDGNLLGVVASTAAAAEAAAARIKAEWKSEPLVPREELMEHFRRTSVAPRAPAAGRYPPLIQRGDVNQGLAGAAVRHESRYELDYIAHTPMEPRSAIAAWTRDRNGDSLTVWYGNQAPFMVRKELAAAFQLDESRVRVISTDLGGAFGGKQRGEIAVEAARLARAAGKPVKLSWTRQEEFTCSYVRPAGLLEVRSGCDQTGKLLAWEFRNYNSGAAGLRPPYDIANLHCAFHRAQSPLRQGSYRSLAAVANTFARESHMDELAELFRQDPLAFRLRNITAARLRMVLERAAERFGWGKWRGGNGRGYGLCCNVEKDGYLALCVELETDGRSARLRRMVAAVDFGAILNPDNLRKQVEGALIMGIGGALFERVRYNQQGILNPRLSRYRVPRFSDVPEIETILIDRRDVPPAGAGEAPITVVAPAVAAALFSATGKRYRALPMLPPTA